MSDDRAAWLARQVRQHLLGLQAAGVEFIPARPAVHVGPMAPALPPVPPTDPLRDAVQQGVPVGPPEGYPSVAGGPDVASLFDEPAVAVPDSPGDRRLELQVLAERVAPCDRCPELYATRTQTVFGVGPVDPDICFVGEAPGADEDATGEPFVGRAGQLLNKIIAACGFKREQVYICNTLKCRPPMNRTPHPVERENCREYFDRQLALVRPKYIVALGLTAAQNLLGTTLSMGKLRGRLHTFNGTPVVCTYHPAALLRNENWKKDTWEDMKMLLRTMGRPIPGAKGS
ncbi:MAG: uracil-DNA glycosylase [Gemmataceae bacterium]|nr:uracil-DNA glycosylase [Gemmataceae bacterium]